MHSIEEATSQSAIIDGDSSEPSPDSSAVVSEDDGRGRSSSRLSRPKLGSRKSSGTMIVSRDAPTTVVDSDFEDDDVRAMSPRRNSEGSLFGGIWFCGRIMGKVAAGMKAGISTSMRIGMRVRGMIACAWLCRSERTRDLSIQSRQMPWRWTGVLVSLANLS